MDQNTSRMRRRSRGLLAVAAVAGVAAAGVYAGQPGTTAKAAATTADRAAAAAFLHTALAQAQLGPGQRVPGQADGPRGTKLINYYNWAGWADNNSTKLTYSQVAGSWTEPSVKCLSKENEVAVFWVGLDGFNNNTVQQSGTLAECYAGHAYYYTWWEMYPTNNIQLVGSTVAAGDQISASVNYSGTTYTLAVTDSTNTANSFSVNETCTGTCARASAEWIAETPSYPRGDAPFPQFSKWTLTGATVTASSGSGVISSFPDDKITIVNSWGQKLGSTSLLASTNNSFSESWLYGW